MKQASILRHFSLLFLLLLSLFVLTPTLAQDDLLAGSLQGARDACADSSSGFACLGSGPASAELREGDAEFANPGDVIEIGAVSALETQAADDAWGVVLVKLPAGVSPDGGESLTMALLGETSLSNNFDPAIEVTICTSSNLNAGVINIHELPDAESAVIGSMEAQQKLTTNARTEDQEWYRVEFSGRLGWIRTTNIGIDCDAEKLAVSAPDDLTILYRSPMQQITLESGSGAADGLLAQAPLNERARILVNNTQIDLSGAAFITARSGSVTVTGLQGRVDVTYQNKTVTVLRGWSTIVPLAGGVASAPPEVPQRVEDEAGLGDLLNSLIFGQPYAGPGSTVPGLRLDAPKEAAEGQLVRADLSFTGDGGVCDVTESPIADVVFAINATDSMNGSRLALVRAAVANIAGSYQGTGSRFGALAFRSQVFTISPISAEFNPGSFEATFNKVFNRLSDEDRGTDSALNTGLATALNMFKQAGPGEGSQVIVLITDSYAENEALTAVIEQITGRDTRLIIVGVGDAVDADVLTGAVGAENVYLAESSIDLPRILNIIGLSVTHNVAVTDFSLRYTVDTERFAVVEDLLALSGGQLNGDTVEWNFGSIYDGQTVEMPLLLRPESEGEDAAGTFEVSYTSCGEEAFSSAEIAAPVLASGAEIENGAGRGALAFGEIGTGTLKAFGSDLWALDLDSSQLISVIVDGPKVAFEALLSGSTIEPLYTLDNFDGSGRSVKVFNVPGGSRWLLLQSANSATRGAYEITLTPDTFDADLVTLEPGGERVSDSQLSSEGRLYNLNVSEGDMVTIRYVGGENRVPFEVISLDGQKGLEVVSRRDDTLGQWISVQVVRGKGPYRVIVKSNEEYGIEAATGDTLTDDRGMLKVGDNLNQTVLNEETVIVRYTLEINSAQAINFVLSGPTSTAVLRDANNNAISAMERITVNTFNVGRYDLAAGSYSVYMEVRGNYNINIVVSEGPLTETLGRLKGTVLLDQILEDEIRGTTPLGIYNLSVGVASKPIAENSQITLFMENVTNAGPRNVLLQSADGLVSEVTLDYVDTRSNRYISVHQLRGAAPYRVLITGLNQFRVRATRGDLLTNDKGALTIGQSLRDSSTSPERLFYNLAPEIGKQLIEGDIVTITFTGQGDNSQFSQPVVTDAKDNTLGSLESYNQNGLFIGVYELRGPGPYKVTIENIGSYLIGATIGNNLTLDAGEVEVGDDLDGTTTGTQIVEYEIMAEAETQFTLTVTDVRGLIGSGNDLTVRVRNSGGEAIEESFSLDGGNSFKQVFTLRGDGPYMLSFTQNGPYKVKLTEGDELTVDKGFWFLGDAEIIDIKDDEQGKVPIYKLQIDEPQQRLTIQTFGAGWLIFDPDGDQLNEDVFLGTFQGGRFAGNMASYTFEKTGVYDLVIFTGAGDYTLRVIKGDPLIVQKGNAYYDVKETDKLIDNARYAAYTIDGEEGDLITVRLDMDRFVRSRRFVDTRSLILGNGDNDPIGTTWTVRDDGYNLFVYELVGPGPYTLFIQPQRQNFNFESASRPQEEYKLYITNGDDARRDKGEIQVEQAIEDEIPQDDGRRTLIYTLANSQEGREVTIELTPTTTSREFDAGSLRLFDPAGNEVDPDVYRFINRRIGRYSFTLEQQGDYRIEFEMTRKYKLEVKRGDIQKAEFGDLFINPAKPEPVFERDADGNIELDNEGNPKEIPYEPVLSENRLGNDQVVALYTISDAQADDVITVAIEARLEGPTRLTNSEGLPVLLLGEIPIRNTTYYIYQLTGEGPYELRFEPGRSNHRVQVDEEIALIADLGPLTYNPQNPPQQVDDNGRPVEYEPMVIENKLELPKLAAQYTIDKPEGEIVTIQLDQRGNEPLDPFVLDANGFEIFPKDSVADGGSLMQTYELTGPGPYIYFFVSLNEYTITATEGDVLTREMGELPVGFLEDPYVNELPEPARIARHMLNVEAGKLITLQIENQRNFVFPEVYDAEGNFLVFETLDFQGDNNIYVYLLSGVGPYEVRFDAFGEYRVIVAEGNLIRVDKGLIAEDQFQTLIEDELVEPGRVVTYAIEGKEGAQLTVELQDNNRPVNSSDFRDANGKLWNPMRIIQVNNKRYAVYDLGGPPPYQVTFVSEAEYNIQVTEGNLLRKELGGAPFGQEVKNKLEAPAQTAVYTILGDPGEIVTVQLTDRGRPGIPVVKNGDGQELPQDTRVDKRNASFVVYTLAGAEPYTLEFNTGGDYTLTVHEGNVLRKEVGPVEEFAKRISASLEFPAEIAIYTIPNVGEGDVISVALQDNNRAVTDGELKDANGEVIASEADITKTNTNFKVYTLSGPGPYTISFKTTGRYNLTVTEGNVLRADKGVLRFGNTATDQLKQPEEAAIYIIDGVPDQIISLKLSDRNQPLEGELVDADGNEIVPWGEANVGGAAYSVYTLQGMAPYTFTFIPKGRYSLTLTEGNVFRAELGTIAFGDSIRNRLTAPVKIASYTINTESDQIISVTVNNAGREFIVPKLFNAEGTELIPLAEVFTNTNNFTGVYLLEGSAPFAVEFEPATNQYTFALERGNITEVELPNIGPKAPVRPGTGGPGGASGGPGAGS